MHAYTLYYTVRYFAAVLRYILYCMVLCTDSAHGAVCDTLATVA
jgi:hypothetical protein